MYNSIGSNLFNWDEIGSSPFVLHGEDNVIKALILFGKEPYFRVACIIVVIDKNSVFRHSLWTFSFFSQGVIMFHLAFESIATGLAKVKSPCEDCFLMGNLHKYFERTNALVEVTWDGVHVGQGWNLFLYVLQIVLHVFYCDLIRFVCAYLSLVEKYCFYCLGQELVGYFYGKDEEFIGVLL